MRPLAPTAAAPDDPVRALAPAARLAWMRSRRDEPPANDVVLAHPSHPRSLAR